MANLNINAKDNHSFDAIVIGSGLSGGWAAKELTEKGLNVLMLERGHELEHIKGYETAMMDPWEFKHRGRITQKQREHHKYLSRDYPYSEFNASYWFKDSDAPYKEKQTFDWFRPDIKGGKSIMWGRQSYRFSDQDFEANLKDGHGIDWPVRYDDIAPWYDYVEEFAGISGKTENYGPLPDGKFQPPMDMNCVEREVKKGIESNFENRLMTIGRVANVTKQTHGRGPCQFRNLCSRGCPYGAYFSTQSSTLPAAEATGNLTVLVDSIVSEVMYDKDKKRATGVRVIDSNTEDGTEFYSDIVFVNASTIGTASILLQSTSDRFPHGLGNDSEVIGHYLMDHNMGGGATGDAAGFEDKYYYGRRPNGIYIPRYRNVRENENLDYVRGFGYQGAASRSDWSASVAEVGVGKDFKEELSEPGLWSMGLIGFGECLPYKENKISLNTDKTDKWGLPTAVFDCGWKENEKKMKKAMLNDAGEMLEAAGLKNVETYDHEGVPGQAIHEVGTARMGKDPKKSVLNKWNQMHDVKNVFVTDGSFMCSSGSQNPSLTFMAFTARACDYAVKELKKGNI